MESSLNACYSGARTFYGQEDGFGMTETGTDLFLRGGVASPVPRQFTLTLRLGL